MRYIVPLLLFAAVSAVGGEEAARRAAHRPNLDVYLYRRCYTPDETIPIRLSAYNLTQAGFAVHRIDLDSLAHTSRDLDDLAKRIQALDAGRLKQVKTWSHKVGKIYPDSWEEREVKVAGLPAGVYLLRARAGGVEKRTWFAVTNVALLAKQSRQETLFFATRADSGEPVPAISLKAVDADGTPILGRTDASGVWRVPTAQVKGNLWAYGYAGSHPVFLLSGSPPAPEPFAVYTTTDRPIYRPGHKVLYKATVRERLESADPGGFTYRPYAGKKVLVEVRDPTDALITRHEATTNANGSLDGQLQLAAEPALGRWQVVLRIGDFRSYAGFEVAAYRKPEYSVSVSFPLRHYLGGSTIPVTIEARYYFGQPVADAAVEYQVSFTGDEDGRPEPGFQGNGVTDGRGQLKLDIKTKRLPFDRTLSITATVTDLSRRRQQASGSTLVTGGLFVLSLETDRALYRPGDRVTVTAITEDHDQKPVSTPVQVRLIETKYDRNHRPYHETTTRRVTTNASGEGKVVFTPPRPGYLCLEAEAFDSEENKISGEEYVWVAGDEFAGYDYPTLELVTDRRSYRPGEVATVLVNTSLVAAKGAPARPAGGKPSGGKEEKPRPVYQRAWALVTLEGERLYRHQVVPLEGPSTVLRVPLEAIHFPSVQLNVAIVQGRHVYEQERRLDVPLENHKLQVSVSPDKERYSPGEKATYTVTARDPGGRPVAAEVGIAVVDESIYAIREDETPEIFGHFYGGQQVRVRSDFSFAARYSGGAFQAMTPPPPGASPATDGIRVRRLFADTAYWNPFVVTDATGSARVTFTMPDNLTTWRATARGITAQTSVGSGTAKSLTTMPLLVRLELPRFFVRGDQAWISAVVHNYTPETRAVKARLEAAGVQIQGEAARTLQLPAGGQQRLAWQATITDAARARFLVVADGGQGAQDATELTLPVHLDGLKRVEATADTLSDGHARLERDLAGLPAGATVTLTLSPSIGAALFEATDYLTNYPYGCAEQTMSAFLPDVAVAQALRRLGVQRKVHPNLDQWVNLGLQKLYRYQHDDGGWNWWEFDETDGDMTAYVLWGLAKARDAGYLVDAPRIQRGAQTLLRLLAGERDLSRRADWLYALAHVQPQTIAAQVADLFAKRDKLDTHGQASLLVAAARIGVLPAGTKVAGPDRKEETLDQASFRRRTRTLAGELEAKAEVRGRTAHWPAEEGGYSWRDDDVEVTARVLSALLQGAPGSGRVAPAVRWLMGNRSGNAWSSTKSSAEAVFALSHYLMQTKELQPEFRARVLLDGEVVKEMAANPQSVFDAPAVVELTPDRLQGKKTLVVDKDGAGILYVSATTAYTTTAAEARPGGSGIAVRRTFQVSAEDPTKADTVASGAEMEVTVEVTADAEYRYAILEDPIPAGCEVAPVADLSGRYGFRDAGGGGFYGRQEVRDNRVVFYFNRLRKGKTFVTYRLHAETPGAYGILPSLAWLMYFPEVRGNSGLVHARIRDREP